MDIYEYVNESVFSGKENNEYLYQLLWENLEEDGFIDTNEPKSETDSILKAYALKNLVNEFIYRVYDEANELDYYDIINSFQDIDVSQEDVLEFCNKEPEIDVIDGDFNTTLQNALAYITEITADKLLELFSSDDLFDYFFVATYAFEQDFTYAFEDYEELQAFVESRQEELDNYKEEYENVLSWIEQGMVC